MTRCVILAGPKEPQYKAQWISQSSWVFSEYEARCVSISYYCRLVSLALSLHPNPVDSRTRVDTMAKM